MDTAWTWSFEPGGQGSKYKFDEQLVEFSLGHHVPSRDTAPIDDAIDARTDRATIAAIEGESQAGDADAQIVLSIMSRFGLGVRKDLDRSRAELLKAAAKGNVHAFQLLGSYYQKGVGVARDDAEALKWHLKAAERGDPVSAMAAASLYAASPGADPDKARDLYDHAAQVVDAKALMIIAATFIKGQGVRQDFTRAARYLDAATVQGGDRIRTVVAEMYAGSPDGFPPDYPKALALYSGAAERGDPQAYYGLAVMHANGLGVPPDTRTALGWLLKSAAAGFAPAQVAVSRAYLENISPRDPVLAYAWFALIPGKDANLQDEQKALASHMTHEQIAEAQALAANWKPGEVLRHGEANVPADGKAH